eukprot:scaffold15742_cov71-Phaeocystis_antarctica.AAC.11
MNTTRFQVPLHFEHLWSIGLAEDAVRSPACSLNADCIPVSVADGRPSAGVAVGPCPGSLGSMVHSEDLEVDVVAVDAKGVGEVVADVVHPKVDDPHDEGGDSDAVAEGGDERDGHREAVDPRHYCDQLHERKRHRLRADLGTAMDEEGAYVALHVVHSLLDRWCAGAQVGAKEELPYRAVARVAEAIDVAARFPEARVGNVRIEDQEEREEHAEHYEVEDADALESVVGPHRIDHVVDLAERRGCDRLRHDAYGEHG